MAAFCVGSRPFRNSDGRGTERRLLSNTDPIIDPLTQQQFPGNIIPKNRLSPAALNLLSVSPLPGPDGFTDYTFSVPENGQQYIGRLDYLLSQKHSFSFPGVRE